METVEVSMPTEHWGKVLDVVRQKKSETLKFISSSEGVYKEVLLYEIKLLEEITEMVKAELLI